MLMAWADWSVWLPGTCQVGRLVCRPGWAATSTVELGQATNPVNRGRVVMEERVELGPKSQRGGEERREWNMGVEQGTVS